MESVSDAYRTDYALDERPAAAEARTGPAARTARLLVVGATAFFTLFIIIAAAGNQWVSDRLSDDQQNTGNLVTKGLYESWLTYNWRFSPASEDQHNVLLGQALLIAVTIVLGTLLILAVTRGPVTFFRAFFGTWMAVIAATQAGAFVRGMVNGDTFGGQYTTRASRALFGPEGPTQFTVWGSAALGLITAIIVAVVAVATRRRAAPAPAPAEPPIYPEYVAPVDRPRTEVPPWQDYGPPPGATTPLPSVATEDVSELTTALSPRHDPGVYGQASAYSGSYAEGGASSYGETAILGESGHSDETAAEQTTQLPTVGAGPGSDAESEHATATLPTLADAPTENQTTELPTVGASAPPEEQSGPGREPADSATAERTAFREPGAVAEPEPAAAPTPPSAGASDDAGENEAAATTRFPRPPDDEDLGHIEPEAGETPR